MFPPHIPENVFNWTCYLFILLILGILYSLLFSVWKILAIVKALSMQRKANCQENDDKPRQETGHSPGTEVYEEFCFAPSAPPATEFWLENN